MRYFSHYLNLNAVRLLVQHWHDDDIAAFDFEIDDSMMYPDEKISRLRVSNFRLWVAYGWPVPGVYTHNMSGA